VLPLSANRTDMRARIASIYLWTNIALGCAVFVWACFHWRCDEPLRFASFLAAGIIASILKIRLPGVTGTASVSVLVIIVAIAELTLAEAVVIGTLSMLAQCTWRTRSKPRAIQVAFSICTLATSVSVSALVYAYVRAHTLEIVSLAAIAVVYFTINSLLIAGIISLTEGKPFLAVWKMNRWALAYYLVGASLGALIGTVPHALQWELPLTCLPVVYLVHRSNRTHVVQMEQEKNHVDQMNALHLRTIEALALAIDAKDHTTHDHLERVQLYALEIGKDLKLTPDEMEALRAAAVLHDIGKLAVPEHIISKPGKLTRVEFERMKVHPVVGAEILERVVFPYPVVPIVRAHHEKWDGSGYPDGLRGKDIPIGARILAAVDCLDALASDRQYRRALPLDEAMAKVAAEAGTSFDPAVVAALQARYVELEQRIRCLKPKLQPALSTDVKVTRGHAPAAGFEDAETPDADQLARLQAALHLIPSNPPIAADHSLRVQELLAVSAVRIKQVVPFDAIAFYFWHENELRAEFVLGEESSHLQRLRVPAGEGLIGWVAEVGQPIVNGNPAVEPGFREVERIAPVLDAALAIPLRDGGERPGVVAIYRAAKDKFTTADVERLLPLCDALGRLLSETQMATAHAAA
jgi:putative nucleotidyltransferase with HDIG domain